MSILNVNTIQPVGSGQTITVSAANISASFTTITANSFTGNVTGNINSTGVSTVSTLSAVNIVGVSTAGIATVYATALRGTSNTVTIPTGHKLVGTDIGSVYAPGSIIQVVQTVNTTDTRITSTSLIDLFSASITPKSSSNKILVMGNLASVARRTNVNSEGLFNLYRGSTDLGIFDGITPWNDAASNQRSVGSIHVQYLDSPNTTSSITYILKGATASGSIDFNDEGGISSLTLMEVSV